ncbi:1-aminocyclopropane-1-carboxylate oxidase 1 [Amborella trichopoda]|nr:1-aminocyclopropane-1-carboxylate oxidase 1 [Amborella trichopoda]|eukprot:XP_006844270.2 1-aminocyclopropane-1-carboxylate oxidase 1 [Amborella trichopoda]
MGVPVIDVMKLRGENREHQMALLGDACENWGFFQIVNHGVEIKVMDRLKGLMNDHYEEYMKPQFQFHDSHVQNELERSPSYVRSFGDWECSFFVKHMPTSNLTLLPQISDDLKQAIHEYVEEVKKVAEMMLDLFCENLGLERGYLKKVFLGSDGLPMLGTKLAKYPVCPRPDLVRGLRAHTDAGGIIFLLQDDQVPGLQFVKDGKWVDVPPLANSLFINIGDQLEVITNGRYKSMLHRVLAREDGSRLSIVTFYNPADDAEIGPAPELTYPSRFRFGEYMNIYASTKFSDKQPRFEAMKKHAVDTPLLV